jgi:peroxiredoxin
MTDHLGAFSIKLPADLQPGLYRLILSASPTQSLYLDFVFNRESIHFSTTVSSLTDSLKIHSSVENKGFYEYLRKQALHEKKMAVFNHVLFNYPEKDHFSRRVSRQFRKQRNRNANYTENLIKKNDNRMFARIIQIHQPPRIADNLPEDEIFDFTRDHFFVNTDFSDTLLLRTPFFPEKALTYIRLFRDQGLSEEEQEEAYIRAVDTIMKKSSVNETLYFILAEYMTNGFESLQMNAVSEYIFSQYILGGPCDRTNMPGELREKAEEVRKFLPGMTAPDFQFKRRDGSLMSLFDVDRDFTLLVFWSTSCPHCTDLMPRLQELYHQMKEINQEYFEILAVGIENDPLEWESYIDSHKLDFINTSELNGWDSELAAHYNINATPMLFLLDRDKKIVQKPDRFRQLERFLQRQLH